MSAWANGVQVGPYVLESAIGAGGMGEVWKAHDTRLGRIVAIKRLHGQQGERFEQEARAIAALNHPNICQIFDIGPDYLVLEYIDGKPLQGPVPVEEAVRLAIQITSALDEAHGRGILHRDLKPANILVTAKGSAKLLDFGLAKLTAGGDADLTKTVEGTVMGTAAYMAPEQIEGKPCDARSDVFSFGAVLYEMLTGRRAFDGMASVLRDDPKPPAALGSLVLRCLAKQPGQRFQTIAEVKAALELASNAKAAEKTPSIAVLPFANMSRDADDEYFSDGLAEEIINALTQVAGLKVIARTSAFAFKGKNEDVRKIAEALGVTNVLEGSVRRAGNRLRVTAQLIHAADGTHLWSQRYDRELTDVFAVQDEMAAAIAGALQVKLTGKATARLHEPNLPAYDAFLKGRHQAYKYTPEGFQGAEAYFQQAIALDPRWADPHSALGYQYFLLGGLGLRPMSEMVLVARAEARKALELLPSEPAAHLVLGAIAALHDYDWKEAEEQCKLVRASGTLAPEIHDMYALFYLLPLGRFEEAIQERKKSIAQDPLNARWRARQAFTFLCADRYELAIPEARKALDLDDRSFWPHYVIAHSYCLQGKLAEALGPAEEAVRIAPWQQGASGLLAGLLAQAGEKERADELLASVRRMTPGGMIMYHLVCSEIDASIDWYQRDIELRQPFAALLASAGFFRPLRASPRWPKLAKMMNLPAP
jgi:eukaryotic-like serine/threonine-protein kinase